VKRRTPPRRELVEARRRRIAERRREEPKWRKPPVRIDTWDCIVCDACARACPPQFGAVFNDGVEVRILPELCSGCDQCIRVCPVDCIHPDPDWSPSEADVIWGYAGGGSDRYMNDRTFELRS
jgi:electron transport complex protein RnfB